MQALIIALIAAIAALSAPGQAVSLSPRSWGLIQDGSPAMVPYTDGAALALNFPQYDGITKHSVNYYTSKTSFSKTTSAVMTMDIQVVADASAAFTAVFDSTNNCTPENPTVRLFFAKKNWLKSNQYARWWANPINPAIVGSYLLQNGMVTMSVPFDPANWTDVMGGRGTDNVIEFTKAIAAINEVGVTFGGGCFFGHGVGVSGGTAVFKITRFEIN